MQNGFSRRQFVEAAGTASLFALAGCTNNDEGGNETPENNESGSQEDTNETNNETEGNETDSLDTEDSNETDDLDEENETGDENETNETSSAETEMIRLGGETEGWQGEAPSEIEGRTNPTLSLQTETMYELTWENLDGEEHELIIADANGEELEASDESEEEGETVTMTFTATDEMVAYYCEYHPETMRGEITFE